MCNITLGVYSVKPYLEIDVVGDEIRSNIPTFENAKKHMKIGNLRLFYKKIGDMSDPDLLDHLGPGGVEMLPYLNFLSQLPPSFETSPVVLGSLIKMMSVSPQEQYEPTDWISILGTYEATLWLGILMVLLVICLILWRRRNENFRTRKHSVHRTFNIFWTTLVAFLQQNPVAKRLKWPKALLFCFSLFVFFIFAYFSGQINTDLVNGIKPFQIDSMEDILLPEAVNYRPVWRKAGMLQKFYEQSPPDSVQGKIWRKAISMGIESSLVTDNIAEVISHLDEIVIFDADLFGKLVDQYSCFLFSKNQKFHISKNTAREELLLVPVRLHNDSCSSYKRKAVYDYIQKMVESGHSKMLVGPENVFLDTIVGSLGFASCIGEKRVSKVQKAFRKVTMENIPLLSKLCGILMCLGAFVLLFEILIYNFKGYTADAAKAGHKRKRPAINGARKKYDDSKSSGIDV